MTDKPFALAVLSGKGGVGKTTICLSLARQLSARYQVWLVDIDLFNRGTTSAIWESEKSIPLSIAELIKLVASAGSPLSKLAALNLSSMVELKLREHRRALTYSTNLGVIPAARAGEGKDASHILWHGMGKEGASAHEFLGLLARTLSHVTPGCIILFDGHGGLDELSLGAAVVSDVTLIINEPDLITFTGSITLYDEITRSCEKLGLEPLIQFIVNRVPPNKSLRSMDEDFGDVLRTISASPQPVVVYFPLERELFGVFGDDPFVSEIFTEYWFSKKIRLLARYLTGQAAARGRLEASGAPSLSKASARQDEIIRTALGRKFFMRGDRLLMSWLALTVAALWILYTRALNAAFASQTIFGAIGAGGDWLAITILTMGGYLFVQTGRWFKVQWRHLGNARRVRARHGRWRRLGDSEAAPLRQRVEEVAEKRGLRRGLTLAGLAVAAVVGIFAALVIPNFLDALQKAKQKRTIADIRNIGTAMFSWVTDQAGAAAAGQSMKPGEMFDVTGTPEITMANLDTVLLTQYVQSIPTLDGWKNPYEYRLDVKNPLKGKNVMSIRSPGSDGKYEGNVYSMGGFDPTDYARDIVWADAFFVRFPSRGTG
ncbi:MAG TPA: P-loop NTPase [Thermoanaerobaculia bacterium]|nr:P-loop NTPase [Thermoanaerobaculia bacterium]